MVHACQSVGRDIHFDIRQFSKRIVLSFLATLVLVGLSYSQTDTATVSGVITDESGAVVVGVDVLVTNTDTNVAWTGVSNGSGVYLVTGLKPGRYRIHVGKEGFKRIDLTDLILNVQDSISLNFTLQIGSTSQTVSVDGSVLQINTQDASVSTIVDRRFVENLPLNGRSFQTLIALTPGVVLTPAAFSEQGQFSVNGQRADANYFTVDGVSANIGVSAGNSLLQFAGGALPGLSVQGGTNSLVSVDALQEFRIQTSTFAPEFGRSPGGQISIVTRSGTNQFHGTLFDYFRNDVLDARDWFVNRNGRPKPKDRQNDFGGVLGGPVLRDRTFFFFSYEGLRLRQPLAQTSIVPSLTSRMSAPPQIQPFLNAFPTPNGPDLGNGFAQFATSYSNPSSLDAYSIRVDHTINSKLTLFGRYNYSPSKTVTRGPGSSVVLSNTQPVQVNTHTFTLGLTQSVSQHISNDVRANYSNVRGASQFLLDNFGGAAPLPDTLIFPTGFSSQDSQFSLGIVGGGRFSEGKNLTNEQRQLNLVDNLSVTAGRHQLKFGVDYRWLAPFAGPRAYLQTVSFSGMTGSTGALSGQSQSAAILAGQGVALLSQNFSVYGQDAWRVKARLTLTYGVRWDINPALKGKNSTDDPFTVLGLDNPATMTLAPRGTPIYETTYDNIAPRVGVVYQLKQHAGWEAVLRGGFGAFYDLASGSLGSLTSGFPFTATKNLGSVPFPLTPQQAAAPVFSQSPPVSTFAVADPHLKLPRTYQWNVSVEQSLGANQSVSATYVGALGRDLLRQDSLFLPNPSFQFVQVTRNTATSDYHALQVKFERRLSKGLQALVSYSYSHSIDIASNDSGTFNTPTALGASLDRGNSDFDVRHSLTGALSYDVPTRGGHLVTRAILGGWSVDDFITVRSALPVTIVGPSFFVAGTFFQARPNVVAGVPLYLFGPQYPGGKAFNRAAFANPPSNQQGNLGRNVLRGFGAWQTDFAVRRQFHLTERLGLQFRAEFFNIFNHPNFGAPTNSLLSPLFGQSTQTLASSMGSGGVNGGFNPLYQVGGPRSIQFALRLTF